MSSTDAELRQALLSLDEKSRILLDRYDDASVSRAIAAYVEFYGAFPRNAVHRSGKSVTVFDPAIVRETDGSYSLYNCMFFDHADAEGRQVRRRHLRSIAEAVRLFLVAEPFCGAWRNYAYFRSR